MGISGSFSVIGSLVRRHWLLVVAVMLVATCVGYNLKSSALRYSESGTVLFTVGSSVQNATTLEASDRDPIIATEIMMTEQMTSQLERARIRAAGGTAQFELTPFNLYDLQYPDYAEPIATLTATSPRWPTAMRTFGLAFRDLSALLARIQAKVGISRKDRIRVLITDEEGPIKQSGSRIRVLAGVALLAIVASFTIANFIDRRRAANTDLARPASPRPRPGSAAHGV
jgi:hypothetical protein